MRFIKFVPIYDSKGNLQVIDRYINDKWIGSLSSLVQCIQWLENCNEKIEEMVVQTSPHEVLDILPRP